MINDDMHIDLESSSMTAFERLLITDAIHQSRDSVRTDWRAFTALEFVEFFSKINDTSRQRPMTSCPIEGGNSRDQPSAFLRRCDTKFENGDVYQLQSLGAGRVSNGHVSIPFSDLNLFPKEDRRDGRHSSLRPRQHAQRSLYPKGPRPYIAKFQLRNSLFKDIDFWALPDILGLFLGLLGLAPAGATKRNFYLPLTAMSRKWCQRLCSARLPTVVQCLEYCGWQLLSGGQYVWTRCREEDNWVMASSPKQGKVLGDSE